MPLPGDTKAAILATVMDAVLLDLERARMEREDFRQGNAPCCAATGYYVTAFETKTTKEIFMATIAEREDFES